MEYFVKYWLAHVPKRNIQTHSFNRVAVLTLRWSSPQVFFLQSDDQPNGLADPADHSRLTENVARAFCVALCPHLKLLKEDGMAKLGLRVTLDSDQVVRLATSQQSWTRNLKPHLQYGGEL